MKRLTSILNRIITPANPGGWPSNILVAIPRIVSGLLLTIDFGASKFGMPWTDSERNLPLFHVASWFPEDVAKFGIPFSLAPWVFAWMGAASEAIGGLFLAVGLGTRVQAFFIACTMLVAMFFQKSGEGVWNMLPAMGFLWVSVYAMVYGSGKIGLDFLLSKGMNKGQTKIAA